VLQLRLHHRHLAHHSAKLLGEPLGAPHQAMFPWSIDTQGETNLIDTLICPKVDWWQDHIFFLFYASFSTFCLFHVTKSFPRTTEMLETNHCERT